MSRTLLSNARLIDGLHPAQPDSTVIVDGDRIAFAGPTAGAGAVEPGDRVLDCAGLSVMPGMVSGHFHSTYHMIELPLMPPIGLERPPAYQAYVAAHNARLALESGVTSVVGANEAWDIDPSLAEAIADGFVVGPRVIAGSRELITSADSNDVVPWYWESAAVSAARICNTPDEFRRAVREEIKRGAQIIKLFASGGHGVTLGADISAITPAELGAAVEAAHRLGKRARAHVASKAGIMMCVEAGVDVIDHGDGMDDECLKALVECGMIWVPSIHGTYNVLVEMGDADPVGGFRSEYAQDFRKTCEMIVSAVEAGVLICLGDDYGGRIIPHGTYGRELGVYARSTGVDALEIVRWATVNGGILVGDQDLGTLTAGAVADVVIVDGDPLEDLDVLADVSNIRAVMRDGRLLVDNLGTPTA
jgi:imidazolonepropionase-like amidohydrolase